MLCIDLFVKVSDILYTDNKDSRLLTHQQQTKDVKI